MINHFLTVRIPQPKALLLTGIYLDHNSVEQRIKLVIRCIVPTCTLVRSTLKKGKTLVIRSIAATYAITDQLISLTVRIPKLTSSLLTGTFLDHSSVKQEEKIKH